MPHAAQLMMQQYIKMVPVIAELKEVRGNYIHSLMDRVHEAANNKAWWNSMQGWADLAGGLAGGVIGLGGSFLPANIQKIADAVSKSMPLATSAGKTFMETHKIPEALEENLIANVTLPKEQQKMRDISEMSKEYKDNTMELLRQRKQATQTIHQAG